MDTTLPAPASSGPEALPFSLPRHKGLLLGALSSSYFFFLRAAPQHMEVPRLGVELELQHYRILNPLSKAKD